MLNYPFNTDLLSDEWKKELNVQLAVIANYWLEKMQDLYKN